MFATLGRSDHISIAEQSSRLIRAVKGGNLAELQELLELGADPNSRSVETDEVGYPQVSPPVDEWISQSFRSRRHGRTLFHGDPRTFLIAKHASRSHGTIVSSLADCMHEYFVGAYHCIALQRMLTALHVAAKEGRAEACRMLLRAGADCLEEMTVSLR